VWKRGTGIVMGVLGNGVLRALLGFMERNYWIVLCFIVLCPTSKRGNLEKWNKIKLRFCCWTITFMTSWLLRKDQKWSHLLRSRVLCCNVKVCKVEGLVIQECYGLSAHLGQLCCHFVGTHYFYKRSNN
jgi:hypothetical protein